LEQLPKPPELASLPSSEPSKADGHIEKDATGYHIEASELFRVFPAVTPEPVPMEPLQQRNWPKQPLVSYQRVEIKLEAALERMKEIQDDRDHWRSRQPPAGGQAATTTTARAMGQAAQAEVGLMIEKCHEVPKIRNDSCN